MNRYFTQVLIFVLFDRYMISDSAKTDSRNTKYFVKMIDNLYHQV